MIGDIMHPGLINIINEGAKYGDVMIGLYTDKAIDSIDNTIFKNITGVKYTTSCAWDNIDYKVYFFDGNTYTEVSKGSLEGTGKNGATQSTIEAVLDTPKDGTFVLAITNQTSKGCRLNVTEIAIQTKQD